MANNSLGYQLALIDVRASHPQKVLLKQRLEPSNAAVREFDWIMETLRGRCHNAPEKIIRSLVESWRFAQRRGQNVTLLEFSREVSDLANLAFQAYRNQKVDIDAVIAKVLADKYKIKL